MAYKIQTGYRLAKHIKLQWWVNGGCSSSVTMFPIDTRLSVCNLYFFMITVATYYNIVGTTQSVPKYLKTHITWYLRQPRGYGGYITGEAVTIDGWDQARVAALHSQRGSMHRYLPG